MKKTTNTKKTQAPIEQTLVLRTCDKSMKGYGGFPWPESGQVEAPEKWNPKWGRKPDGFIGGFRTDIECGGGLHGIEDPFSDNWEFLNWNFDAKALLVSTEKGKMIRIDGKVKFQSGIVEKVGTLASLICGWACDRIKINALVKSISDEANKDYATNASSGRSATNEATGKMSVCMAAGFNSIAKASEDGAIALAWNDGKRPRIAVGYVGEDGIKADAWYKVEDGKLVEVK